VNTAVHRGGAAAMASHPHFQRLKHFVIATTGLQYYADKDDALAERVEARRSVLGCGPADYFNRVLDANHPEEFAALVDEITVGESYFFRYPHQFDALRHVVVPACMANRPPDLPLRVWSAGCASGAEAYSVAILLRGEPAEGWGGRRCSILGTDINRKAIAAARAGIYNNWDLRVTTEAQKRQWFDQAGASWSIRPEFREGVTFTRHNLVADIDAFAGIHAGAFDIIFCRNVMIYFSAELMRRLLHRISECLADGGWLFVGHAEPYFEIANFLAPVPAAGAAIYRKSPTGTLANHCQEPVDVAPAWIDEQASISDLFPPPPAIVPAPAIPGDLDPLPKAAEPAAAAAADQGGLIRRHSDAGNWAAAMEVCELGLRQRPLDATLHFARALICEHMGAPDTAEQALRQALYLDRSFALAHFHLGRLLAGRGDRRSAERSFRNAMRVVEGHADLEAVSMGDGLTVAECRELARTHLALLERRR